MSMDVRMDRKNQKINKATERNEGSSVICKLYDYVCMWYMQLLAGILKHIPLERLSTETFVILSKLIADKI